MTIYYEELAKLKRFSNNTTQCSSIDNFEVIQYEIKAFLQGNTVLNQIYQNKINEFQTIKNGIKYKRLMTNITKYIYEISPNIKINSSILNALRFCYLPNYFSRFGIDTPTDPTGIENLYIQPVPLTEHWNKFKDSKVLSLRMYFPKIAVFQRFLQEHRTELNVYMFSQTQDDILTNSNDNFYLLYLKAVTNGTLNYFIRCLTPNTLEYHTFCENDKNTKSKQNINKLTNRENELVEYVKQGYSTYKELETKMGLSERGVKQHLGNINNKLCSNGTGINALKETLRK